jgi:formate dehydrogenase major subunit
MEAKRRGATIIHVDPRFTRTSAMADIHVPIRAGSDIAFLGGIVHHIIENERFFREYVVEYTNAATLIDRSFKDTEELDGLFSGWDQEKHRYDPTTWQYQQTEAVPAAGHKHLATEVGAGSTEHELSDAARAPRDPTLQDPSCVFQILKRHFARYTPEMVERTCGVPRDMFLKVAETLCANSGRDRTSAMAYAVGWTQHTVGVQYIRTAAIIQLLLGNMGRPGGGIMALRGHASIQGSTDIPTLFNILPGYLPMPHAGQNASLQKYIDANRSPSGWWSEFHKYIVSFLKAWYGDHARADNEWGFENIPAITGDHSHLNTVALMADGKVGGYFVMGENPTVGTVNGALHREGLRRLDWLVVRDFSLVETAEFWRTAPEVQRGEVRPEDIDTEVFFFPAAAHTEKDGSFTNTQRMLQWHHKAIDPPGDARSELWFMVHLGKRLKALYADSTDPRDQAIRALTWDYDVAGPLADPDAHQVLQEVNGWKVENGELLSGFRELKDDGSTAAGCWIYTGCFANGVNQPARRKSRRHQTWVAPEWGWAWPMNRRLLYNRASADPDGRPWSERKRYVWWDEDKKKWVGADVPDFIDTRPPSYRPGPDAQGLDTIPGNGPFIMQADSRGWIFAPTGIVDGPLPTHYEPQESIIENPLYPRQQCNPARLEWRRPDNPYHAGWGDPRFPYVLTTYRLTEHHTAGGMTRWLSWLSELQPDLFCEISPELAAREGLRNGAWATIRTARGELECRVLVSERLRPLRLNGKVIHQIGLPYHFGAVGRVRGDSANELFPFVADPNVQIMETKAITAAILPGRQSHLRRAATSGPLGGPLPPEVAKRSRGVSQSTAAPPQRKPYAKSQQEE